MNRTNRIALIIGAISMASLGLGTASLVISMKHKETTQKVEVKDKAIFELDNWGVNGTISDNSWVSIYRGSKLITSTCSYVNFIRTAQSIAKAVNEDNYVKWVSDTLTASILSANEHHQYPQASELTEKRKLWDTIKFYLIKDWKEIYLGIDENGKAKETTVVNVSSEK